MDYLKINELYHHGILGQRKGIRRYQNYDGTLTEEGRLRYNKNYKKNKADDSVPTKDKDDGNYYYKNKDGDKVLYKTRTDQLSNEELSDLSKRINLEKSLDKENESAEYPERHNTSQAFRDASKLAKDISESLPKGNGRVVKKNYSNLSDQELRDRINRLQLEDNYGRLSGDTKYIKSGSEKAREFLQTAGALLAITGSAVALANTIADMQERKKRSMQHSDIFDEDENCLEHHGIKGQKWGVRRFQNPDGSLTEEGKKRYNEDAQKLTDVSTSYAELVDLTRKFDLFNSHKNNTEILMTKEDTQLWKNAYQSFLDFKKKYEKYNISTKTKTLEDGTDYIVSSMYDKKLGGTVEYYEPLFYDSNGKKYDEKNRLYNTTKSYNQQIKHSDELMHHGILGMKWGIRRYQNEDGTLTSEGQARYGGKTHVDELSDEEKADLQEAGRKDRNKKIAIGVGVAAAAVTVGAVWLAKRKSAANMLQKPIDNLPHDDDNNTQSILKKQHGELDFGGLKGDGKTGINLGDLEENQKPRNLPDFLNTNKKPSVSESSTQNSGGKPRNLPDFLNTNKKPSDSNSSKKLVDISKFGKKAEANASNNTNDNVNLLNMVKKNNPNTNKESDFSINGIIDKVNNKPIDSIKPTSTVSDKDISSLIAKIDGSSSNLFNTKTYQSTPTVSSGTQKIGDKSLTRTVTANFTSDDISDSKERSFLNRLYMPKERFDSNNEAEFTKKFIDTFGEAEYKKTLDRRNPFEARGYSTSISRDSSTVRPRGVSAKSSAPQSVKDKISSYKDSHKLSNSSVYVKNGSLYKYHNGKEILVKGGADSRYEYTTNSSGQILRTVKKNFKPSWLRHYDNSDYLVFREMYLSSFDTLAHHGIKGQKWGVRRYQDQNGTLTPEGRKRYRSDQGTREIIENTSSYNDLLKANRREYANYGRTSGGKKGFILGMGSGALVGAGKAVFDTVINRDRVGKSFGYSSGAIVNRFVRNTMLGALGGSVIGTLIGSSVGKRSAQAELADKGQEYTNALMNVPLHRLLRSS